MHHLVLHSGQSLSRFGRNHNSRSNFLTYDYGNVFPRRKLSGIFRKSRVANKSKRKHTVEVSAGPQFSLFARRNVPKEIQSFEENGPPGHEYDVAVLNRYYSRRPLLVIQRITQLFGAGAVFIFEDLISRDPDGKSLSKRAARARKVVSELGPAFVKIGQALSARPDLFPEEVLEELRALQDDIPPFDSNVAMRVIEREMNRPISEVFSELTAEPVAAASIGQVYKGRLRSEEVEVAVKVQRPGMRAAIALDIFLLRHLATLAMKFYKTNTDLPGVVDEWAASLYKELDYRLEAESGERFRAQLEGMKEVLIPRTFQALTTQHVLILEWVDGLKINQVKGETSKQLVEIGVQCSLAQLLDAGFYHADPHPGNLLMTLDGRLAYLDFGMMGELDSHLRYGLVSALVHLINQEYDDLADDFVELEMLPKGQKADLVVPALTSNLKGFMNTSDTTLSDVSFATLFTSLSETMYQYKFRIPSYYTLIIRSLGVLEGIALESDPDFKVLRSAYPWVAQRLLSDPDPAIQRTLTSLLYSREGVFQYQRLENLIQQAGSHRPSDLPQKAAEAAKESGGDTNRMRGFLTASSTASSAQSGANSEADIQMLASALSFVLSERGEFLLDVLLTEIAKGLESGARVQVLSAMQGMQPAGSDIWVLADLLPGQSRVEEDMQRVASITSLVGNLATGVLGVSSSTSRQRQQPSRQQTRPSQSPPSSPQTTPSPPSQASLSSSSSARAAVFTDRFRSADRAALLQASRDFQVQRRETAASKSTTTSPEVTEVTSGPDTVQIMRQVVEYLSPETQQKAMQLPARLLEKLTNRTRAPIIST